MSRKKLVLANNPLLSGPTFENRERSGSPYRELPLSSIDRDPNQPRVHFDDEKLQELSESIRTYGVLSPILVTPAGVPGRYKLVAGERRFRAAGMAGLTSIPAIVDSDSEQEGDRALAVQLVENLQRADLTPLERSHAIGALKETYSLSIREIAERLGVSKGMVQRSLEILDLPDDLLNALREGASESKVLILSKIEDVEIRKSYLKDLDTLTRSQIEKDLETKKSGDDRGDAALTPEDRRISDEIQRALGLKVKMVRSGPNSERGRLTIEFYTEGDLQEIFRRLVG